MGLGPGAKEQMTLAVADALETVETVVGYRTYLDLVPPEMLAGKAVVGTGMTRELERAQTAIDRALTGEAVAVVSGGDAGVYGMAGLVLDCVEARGLSESVPVEVLPGVPALAAAAALLGAPLMHDFACVSLSDLLTPWETIETRLCAAAQADFVLVLYNPRSHRRSDHLARALAVIADHRAPGTPVGLVRGAFREGQEVLVSTLAEFNPETADMVSIVLVGNSQTRLTAGRMVTPRGYFDKYGMPKQKGP